MMLIDADPKVYNEYLSVNPHPFVSPPFIELNRSKVERVVRLVANDKPSIGLIAGIKEAKLKSPFSAPFGGFHFKHEQIYITEISDFLLGLIRYAEQSGIKAIEITLPPDVYHPTFNAKVNNVLLRSQFMLQTPEITNWVDLREFNGKFTFRSAREYYNQAVRNRLVFYAVEDDKGRNAIYEVVRENRARMGRPIYMSPGDLKDTSALWPVDYFGVKDPDDQLVAGAIMYRVHPSIIQAVFWGDSERGRPLRAMDFLVFNLWSHYKNAGYHYIDLGISTERGQPNEGLLRFKETHECVSSMRYAFSWETR